MVLITYALAVRHLKQDGVLPIDVSPAEENVDVAAKIEQASAIVLQHLKREGEWDETTDPADDPEFAWVQALTLRVLSWLYRFRGDGSDETSLEDIFRKSGSSMLRDPSLA